MKPLKAYFQKMTPDGTRTVGAKIPVTYNPTDFSIVKGNQLAEIGVPGLTAPLQQFVRGNAAKLTVKLFFDSTDDGMGPLAGGVTDDTDQLYSLVQIESGTHAPPVCRFVWGHKFPGSTVAEVNQSQPHFVGVVESIQQEFTLFSPKGIPLRATLTVTMREYKPLATQPPELRPGSPDRTHAHVVGRHETLSSIAALVYGDPTKWRPLADHNGITDPRRVSAGTVLAVPPIEPGAVV
jgi:hypothetical protein